MGVFDFADCCYAGFMQSLPKPPLELDLQDIEGCIVEQDGMYVWTGIVPDESLDDMIQSVNPSLARAKWRSTVAASPIALASSAVGSSVSAGYRPRVIAKFSSRAA